MPGLILDSSVAIAWLMPDEPMAPAQRALDLVARDGAIVPVLWHLEVANIVLVAVRRGRLAAKDRDRALHRLGELPIETDPETGRQARSSTINLAERHGLSVYDATYLELASRLSLPLATLDRDVSAAAAAQGVKRLLD
ncbi:MAG: type II toxin-antitoxin system VapC family toxin [Alphaproteobacteria bacterium]